MGDEGGRAHDRSDDAGRTRRTLSSVRNAARLLKEFSIREPELGVTELSGRLGIGKSTVHRLLATLLSEDLVEQDPTTGRYRLGLAVHDLVSAVSAGSNLHAAVVLPMSDLRDRTGETVQIGVLDGREVVYVERLDSPNALRLFVDVGRRSEANATGTGKCLLAFLPPDHLDRVLEGWELRRRTPHTIANHAELRRDLRRIRRLGYAVAQNESEMGVLSVAAPIRDTAGRVIAAISVAGPAQRMEHALSSITRAVSEAGATASRRLGWRAPSADSPAL